MPRAAIITVTGVQFRSIEPEEVPMHKVLNDLVGGWIEVVRIGNDHLGYINEEGKIMRLPVNKVATALYRPRHDVIAGTMVLFGPNAVEPDMEGDISAEMAQRVLKWAEVFAVPVEVTFPNDA